VTSCEGCWNKTHKNISSNTTLSHTRSLIYYFLKTDFPSAVFLHIKERNYIHLIICPKREYLKLISITWSKEISTPQINGVK
jgi:hypothetical protein